MLPWAVRFQSILSLPQRHALGRAAMMGGVGGAIAVMIGAWTVLKGLGLLCYVFLGAGGGVLGIVVSLMAPLLHRAPSVTKAPGTHKERPAISAVVMEPRAAAPASRWAARFQTLMALPQGHGPVRRAALMGIVGSAGALVISGLPAVQEALKALGPLVYVFLPALGGACGMMLSLIAPVCPRFNARAMTVRVPWDK